MRIYKITPRDQKEIDYGMPDIKFTQEGVTLWLDKHMIKLSVLELELLSKENRSINKLKIGT